MSLSYTGEATMDEPALRDVERWKDKIEVRLDNRQVFFLFFGSALCACMLFVLGVIVGKRLESRGRAAVPEVQDPLAVLDRINAVGPAGATAPPKPEPALTYPKALIGAPTRGRAMAAVSAAPAAAPPAPVVARVSTPTSKTPPLAARATPPAAPKPVATAAAPKLVAAAAPKLMPAAAPSKTPPAAASAPGTKGKLALQLSSFPDRGEAEAFARRFAAQGAYVVVSEIPGKGTWYRVRVGSYSSSQEAIAAKGTFEKQTNVIAYIAGR
jgi:cell division septation protein DedD